MERLETPVIILSAVILIVNIATVLKTNSETENIDGFTASKQSDSKPHSECAKIRSRTQCSTSYGQNYVDALSKCGSQGSVHINYTESQCRKNDNGEYCGVVLTSSSVAQFILENCTDDKSCTPGCADILRKTLDYVGCCFTGSAFARYYNSCGIFLPPPCSPSSLKIPTIKYDSPCSSSSDEFTKEEYLAQCESIPPVYQALIAEKECKVLADEHNLSCSMRNNQYCAIQLQIFNKQHSNSTGMQAIFRAASHCPTDTSCSSQCKNSLSIVKEEVGCCINTFDSSILDYQANFTSLLSDKLWNKCGIKRPKTCNASAKMYIGPFIVLFTIIVGCISKYMFH